MYLSKDAESLRVNSKMEEQGKTHKDIAKSLCRSGIPKPAQANFNDQLKNTAEKRVKTYKREIKKYEAKYGSFKEFTKKISGKASLKQEDLWMEWEAAINMLKAWKQINIELDSNASK